MANRFHNQQVRPGNNKTSTPPSPGLGKMGTGMLGKDGVENWTHKGGSNIFGRAIKSFKKIKIHPVSSN